jgi:energy-coupling factor transporter ATP-binding protein EcfA2
MPSLPVIEHLRIDSYGLYPGIDGHAVDLDLSEGLTLILGANGIGKSTLVQLLFRMLTGPTDIPSASGPKLGRSSIETKQLSGVGLSYFAQRVNDRAEVASATLTMKLGSSSVRVERRLKNLSLLGAEVNGMPLVGGETELKAALVAAAGLGDYSDWILILRYILFLPDGRQPLIWDADAQRQLLRPLFTDASTSNHWRKLEAKILTKDSARRNLSAAEFQQKAYLRKQAELLAEAGSASASLLELEAERDELNQELEDEELGILELQESRDRLQLDVLSAEDQLERERSVHDRKKLLYILQSAPELSTSGKYLLARNLQSPTEGRCPVCGSALGEAEHDSHPEARASEAASTTLPAKPQKTRLDAIQQSLNAASAALMECVAALSDARDRRNALRRGIADIVQRVSDLGAELPDAERKRREVESQARITGQQIKDLDAELEELHEQFGRFLREQNSAISDASARLQESFSKYASSFLFEESELTYEPRRSKVGQLPFTVEYPYFELRMSGSDFAQPTMRRGDDDVSESQREFIDLAFRMALIEVAAKSKATLVLDSPESSLDAVFEPQAAAVFARFMGTSSEARVVITSNLATSNFIPDVVNRYREASGRRAGVIDLFEIGRPTAAVEAHAEQYRIAKESVLEKAGLAEA